LKAALAARDAAQQSVVDARATLERLEEIVHSSDDAAREATNAKQRAAEARRVWARSGKHSDAVELLALDADAREKATEAERAAVDAAAVRNELGHALDMVRYQQSSIRECEDEISAAVGEILVAEATPVILERLDCAAAEYRQARAVAICFQSLLATERYEARQAINQRVIDDALERNLILPWDRERENPRARDVLNRTNHERQWLDGLTAPWRERAQELRADPDA
jgi:hypothetical protein